jgi:hypothetical protein
MDEIMTKNKMEKELRFIKIFIFQLQIYLNFKTPNKHEINGVY